MPVTELMSVRQTPFHRWANGMSYKPGIDELAGVFYRRIGQTYAKKLWTIYLDMQLQFAIMVTDYIKNFS